MVRKQVLCCGALLSSLLVAKVSGYYIQDQEEQNTEQQVLTWHIGEEKVEEERGRSYFHSLQFASEKLPIEDGVVTKRLSRHLNEFSKKNFYRRFNQAQTISDLKTISEILLAHGIPEDFKYIPIIESGFDPEAVSSQGATGYWQFMSGTAKSFGLRVDEQVDERRNLHKSTTAAAKYLKTLYKEFGSWSLVAAAFNTGDGNLKKAISRQGGEMNYFKLRLNQETAHYVYKLIAVKEVMERPGYYQKHRNELYASSNAESEEKNHIKVF